MATEDLGRIVSKERARLVKLKQSLADKRKALDAEIAEVEKQITAADAYASALGGRARKAKAAGAPKQPRAKRASGEPTWRDRVLDTIKGGNGLKRGEILAAMSIVEKENKGAAQNVSNALNALKKAGTIKQEDGKYTAAA